MTTDRPAWYTTAELTPSGPCRGDGDHEWLPEGNGTYLRCYKGKESADMHLVDDDGTCMNCGIVHWRPEAVEAHHEQDEMNTDFQEALHRLADRSVLPEPITIAFCTMPDEAGQ